MRKLFIVLLGLILSVSVLLITPKDVCAVSSSTLLSEIRRTRGDSIPTSSLLTKLAQNRAIQITTNFSHDGAGAGLSKYFWGEILAWNTYPDGASEATAVQQWLDSSSHRRILLNDSWTHVGVGVANSGDKHYYAAIFAIINSTAPTAPKPKTTTDKGTQIKLPPTDC